MLTSDSRIRFCSAHAHISYVNGTAVHKRRRTHFKDEQCFAYLCNEQVVCCARFLHLNDAILEKQTKQLCLCTFFLLRPKNESRDMRNDVLTIRTD